MKDSAQLKPLADAARELANKLFDGPCNGMGGGERCMEREEHRKLKGRARPFPEYDYQRLCSSCAPYWLTEMAAQELHRAYCLAVRSEAKAAHA